MSFYKYFQNTFILSCILVLIACQDNRKIKYAGFNDLAIGSQSIYLYENGEFSIELGLGYSNGTYNLNNDTIYLSYSEKTDLPSVFLLKTNEFTALNYEPQINIHRTDTTKTPILTVANVKPIEATKEEITKGVKPKKKHKIKTFYVNSKLGVKYFEEPKGEYLGTFLLNTPVTSIKSTGIFENRIHGNDTIKTEWLGVLNNRDTVYCLSTGLSNNFTYSDLNIYHASPYNKENPILRSGFINITTSPIQQEVTLPNFPKKHLGHDLIAPSKTYRSLFLKQRGISESDTVYIHAFQLDSILSIPVKDLSIIAAINTWRHGDKYVSDSDYEIGFNLKKRFINRYGSFAFIGKKQIFKASAVTPVVFEKIDFSTFPIQPADSLLNTYKFTFKHWTYFIQNQPDNQFRHLVIKDNTTGSIITNKWFYASESIYLPPLSIKGQQNPNLHQKTVYLIKNKPPILTGLNAVNYACSTINFIYQSEPPILIRCDNRD